MKYLVDSDCYVTQGAGTLSQQYLVKIWCILCCNDFSDLDLIYSDLNHPDGFDWEEEHEKLSEVIEVGDKVLYGRPSRDQDYQNNYVSQEVRQDSVIVDECLI